MRTGGVVVTVLGWGGIVLGVEGRGTVLGRLRFAATDLQKRVLVGLARHWGQVPGPLMPGSSGGAALVGWVLLLSLASSAQMQGVPS